MNRVALTVCMAGVKKRKRVLFNASIPKLVKLFRTIIDCRLRMVDSCFLNNDYVKMLFKEPDIRFTTGSTVGLNSDNCNSLNFVFESESTSVLNFGMNDYSLCKDCLILNDEIKLQYSDITELINSWCSDPKTLLRINTEA